MSIQQVALVLDFAPAHWSSGIRMVAIALGERVNENYVAFPGLADMSRRSGLSTRMVRRYLAELEAENVIERLPNFRDNRQTSNLYTWLWRVDKHSLGRTPSTGEGRTCSTGGEDTQFLQNPHRTLIKKEEHQ